VADQTSPGRRILYQDVALEPIGQGGALTLSLFAYYKAQQGPLATPSPETLDHTAPGTNQQYRIDVMKSSAPLDSVDSADILARVFQTRTGDPQSIDPTRLTADLTPFAGQTVRLRFAEVDNAGVLNTSTDDVRIETTPPPGIQFGKPTRNRKKGTATLPATVPTAGSIEISGNGIATRTVQADAAGTFDLPVIPVKPLKAKIKKERKGTAKISATFTSEANGAKATDNRRVHLRRKRR